MASWKGPYRWFEIKHEKFLCEYNLLSVKHFLLSLSDCFPMPQSHRLPSLICVIPSASHQVLLYPLLIPRSHFLHRSQSSLFKNNVSRFLLYFNPSNDGFLALKLKTHPSSLLQTLWPPRCYSPPLRASHLKFLLPGLSLNDSFSLFRLILSHVELLRDGFSNYLT